jgi:CRP-like cAMP-binding protein
MMSLKFEQPTYLPNLALHTFKSRTLISIDRNTLWQIESGVVRTSTWDREGNFITLGFWGAGDVVGLPLSGVRPYQIESINEVKAYTLSNNQQIRDRIWLAHIQQTEKLLRIMHCNSLEQRLLEFLLWLAEKFGSQTHQGRLIQMRLTHQTIAEAIGSTRVSVTRLMGKFEREGAIYCCRKRFILLPNHFFEQATPTLTQVVG